MSSDNWSEAYKELTDRNIGILTEEQQERLRTAKITVFGAGGLGGTIFEILVRSGVGTLDIIDRDVFDVTNLNRQVFAYRHTVGQRKIDVAADWAKQINPDIVVNKYDAPTEENIEEILTGSSVGVMGIDELKACIVIARKAREMDIPLVEGWALPYGNVRVISAETPSLEETYGLSTVGRPLSEISDEEFECFDAALLVGLGKIADLSNFMTDELLERVAEGKNPTFCPMVWLTSVLMALEALKLLLGWGEMALGPSFALYDPLRHRIP